MSTAFVTSANQFYVVRILLGDLRELGLVTIKAPVPMQARKVDKNTLREVLHGLRGL